MVPVVPFVVVFDGVVSSLRTRMPDEVRALMMRRRGQNDERKVEGMEGWTRREREERKVGEGDENGEIRKRRRNGRERQAITTTTTTRVIRNEIDTESEKDETEPEPEPETEQQPIDYTKWHFSSGTETHTWPLGELNWFVAVKRE